MDTPAPLTDAPGAMAGTEVGPYRLIRPLGKGGMAEVFLAVHRHLGHVRALKVLWPDASEARTTLAKRLLAEARATSRLQHPAIVQVFDCDNLPSGGAFIAMEYLQGEPAGEWLERTGSLAAQPRLAAALIGVVADALAHAHRQGIIHRDIKPDNMILIPDQAERTSFAVKILDFGIAKMLNEQPLVVTHGDRVLGTPLYMAPEQWMGGNSLIDARTDVYSLGCLLFEVLTGRPPFDRESGPAMMHAHLEELAPGIRELVPGAPAELEALVHRMLAKAPDARPQTMAEVLAPLESFLGRDRSTFAQLLQAPPDFPVGAGSARQSAATHLGLGATLAVVSSSTTVPIDQRRRFLVRWAAGAGLAIVGVGALVGASKLLAARRPAQDVAERGAARALPPRAAVVDPVEATLPVRPSIVRVAPPARPTPEKRRTRAQPRPRNVYRPVGD